MWVAYEVCEAGRKWILYIHTYEVAFLEILHQPGLFFPLLFCRFIDASLDSLSLFGRPLRQAARDRRQSSGSHATPSREWLFLRPSAV